MSRSSSWLAEELESIFDRQDRRIEAARWKKVDEIHEMLGKLCKEHSTNETEPLKCKTIAERCPELADILSGINPIGGLVAKIEEGNTAMKRLDDRISVLEKQTRTQNNE